MAIRQVNKTNNSPEQTSAQKGSAKQRQNFTTVLPPGAGHWSLQWPSSGKETEDSGAFPSWPDRSLSACRHGCLPGRNSELLSTAFKGHAAWCTPGGEYRYLTKPVRKGKHCSHLPSPAWSFIGYRSQWNVAPRPFNWQIQKAEWLGELFSTPAREYTQKASFVLLVVRDDLCGPLIKFEH